MRLAITREVSPSVARCELSFIAREPIDPARAAAQHAEYESALASLGYAILRLPADPDLPDSVFVEDAALVFDELAVITRPGAESRRPETVAIAEALKPYRKLAMIDTPATLDGGDVLRVGRKVYVGLSRRTSPAAVDQLSAILAPYGYRVQGVEMDDCLHFKTAVTQVADNTLLINRSWVDPSAFAGCDLIDVDPSEPYAGNALLIDDTVIFPAAYVATRARLESRGVRVLPVPADELAKAEGGVTCCSLLLP